MSSGTAISKIKVTSHKTNELKYGAEVTFMTKMIQEYLEAVLKKDIPLKASDVNVAMCQGFVDCWVTPPRTVTYVTLDSCPPELFAEKEEEAKDETFAMKP
jgi:hypothetical protein